MRQFKRTGLTLVELLAVIAIIGLLAGLLLPAVQSAREGGRRTTCASNLRQLGQGLQQFHAARGSLPVTTAADMVYSTTADPSAYMRYRRLLQSQTGSDINNVYTWIVGVMPFIEQQTFYDKFDLKGLSNSPTNQPLVQTPRANLICPSDPDANTPILPRRGFSAVNYATSTDADGNLMHGVWYAGSAGPALEFGSNQFCQPEAPAGAGSARATRSALAPDSISATVSECLVVGIYQLDSMTCRTASATSFCSSKLSQNSRPTTGRTRRLPVNSMQILC